MSSIVGMVKEKLVDELDQIPKPSCSVTHLGFQNVTRQSVCLASTLSVKNPYDHDLPLLQITYKILSNNKELGNGQVTDTGDIKANGDTAIELPTTIEYDFLWNLVKDIGSDWDIDYTLEVGVQFKLPIVGSFTIPLDHSGTIKLPTISELL
jgi:LEA14-like dessication related protein